MLAAYDLVWSSVTVVAFGLAVWGIVSLSRGASRLSSATALVWALVILLVPVLGPVSWLLAGRRAGVART
ncbi:Phospholipase_D-nuclease N-terminal [Microbacterium sp. ru370.1]|nr:Phospholipase_D-nuclease N-terminal [Microbacterium sp. ru370.1]SIT89316.1 Phospholipase_D-nuclease N-terminal [Microbacterium sp. RU1D]